MYSREGYHKLLIWQKSKEFTKAIYIATETFPKSELFGITSQIRRATVSICLNIVEGHRRESKKEFIHFLDIADGSLAEVEACLELSCELQFLPQNTFEKLQYQQEEISKMLAGMIRKLKDTVLTSTS
jgi:four helix bundle protein